MLFRSTPCQPSRSSRRSKANSAQMGSSPYWRAGLLGTDANMVGTGPAHNRSRRSRMRTSTLRPLSGSRTLVGSSSSARSKDASSWCAGFPIRCLTGHEWSIGGGAIHCLCYACQVGSLVPGWFRPEHLGRQGGGYCLGLVNSGLKISRKGSDAPHPFGDVNGHRSFRRSGLLKFPGFAVDVLDW